MITYAESGYGCSSGTALSPRCLRRLPRRGLLYVLRQFVLREVRRPTQEVPTGSRSGQLLEWARRHEHGRRYVLSSLRGKVCKGWRI